MNDNILIIKTIVMFFAALWVLRRIDAIDAEHIPIIIVFGGLALAGYLGVSNY